MTSQTSICVGLRKASSRLSEGEPVVGELLSKVSQLSRSPHYLCLGRAMSHNFGFKGVVIFLVYGPVDPLGVELSVGEEEFLPKIKGGTWNVVGSCMEGSIINRARPSQGA